MARIPTRSTLQEKVLERFSRFWRQNRENYDWIITNDSAEGTPLMITVQRLQNETIDRSIRFMLTMSMNNPRSIKAIGWSYSHGKTQTHDFTNSNIWEIADTLQELVMGSTAINAHHEMASLSSLVRFYYTDPLNFDWVITENDTENNLVKIVCLYPGSSPGTRLFTADIRMGRVGHKKFMVSGTLNKHGITMPIQFASFNLWRVLSFLDSLTAVPSPASTSFDARPPLRRLHALPR